MSTTHTPGPRRAVKGPDKLYTGQAPGTVGFVLAPDGKTVVGRFHRYEDAVLDAAAPELLAEAEKILADLREQEETGLCSRMRIDQIVALAKAIAKATGGQ